MGLNEIYLEIFSKYLPRIFSDLVNYYKVFFPIPRGKDENQYIIIKLKNSRSLDQAVYLGYSFLHIYYHSRVPSPIDLYLPEILDILINIQGLILALEDVASERGDTEINLVDVRQRLIEMHGIIHKTSVQKFGIAKIPTLYDFERKMSPFRLKPEAENFIPPKIIILKTLTRE